ncbi:MULTISPECIES: diaminopimelate epimerase [unclassified Campylobacter]|uniref:diaminopimelate epimerase n=1 Tax=unclassified Campylobacter TaxID=2593542 RepID=UPI001237CF60|nr:MULTISPECIES: diaminopimelate epimerase [unclassified Campylobacter]KAA6227165.1 diaminopimelate epimerase [Campylobacter sp. LR286c]KAA6229371.1 diaminopimelate epimerase [Campylobacter sp. LR291e]KAA6231177.1 diaminopimelate epimerase [Campylobacter sp. LR264d]
MIFYKYYANGNDFVIFNAEKKEDLSKLAILLCNRYSGIGSDGLIAILKHEKYDFEWQFYNKDGSMGEMCGNGARAAAHFFHHFNKGKNKLSFLTDAGVIRANVEKDMVEISLGEVKDIKESFEFKGKIWQGCNTGVPHLVCFVDDINEFNKEDARFLRQKYNANVNYVQIINKDFIKVRTFERGVENETLACGTGMSACFYLGKLKNLLLDEIKISPKSEDLAFCKIEKNEVYLKAKVKCCFEAHYYFD